MVVLQRGWWGDCIPRTTPGAMSGWFVQFWSLGNFMGGSILQWRVTILRSWVDKLVTTLHQSMCSRGSLRKRACKPWVECRWRVYSTVDGQAPPSHCWLTIFLWKYWGICPSLHDHLSKRMQESSDGTMLPQWVLRCTLFPRIQLSDSTISALSRRIKPSPISKCEVIITAENSFWSCSFMTLAALAVS